MEKGGHDVIFKVHVDPTGSHLIIGGNQVLRLRAPSLPARLPRPAGATNTRTQRRGGHDARSEAWPLCGRRAREAAPAPACRRPT